MTSRDPLQRAADGAILTLDAYRGGQLDALRKTLQEFEGLAKEFAELADDLRRRIREIESSRNEGLFEIPDSDAAD
jgi:hypothetical protein